MSEEEIENVNDASEIIYQIIEMDMHEFAEYVIALNMDELEVHSHKRFYGFLKRTRNEDPRFSNETSGKRQTDQVHIEHAYRSILEDFNKDVQTKFQEQKEGSFDNEIQVTHLCSLGIPLNNTSFKECSLNNIVRCLMYLILDVFQDEFEVVFKNAYYHCEGYDDVTSMTEDYNKTTELFFNILNNHSVNEQHYIRRVDTWSMVNTLYNMDPCTLAKIWKYLPNCSIDSE
jgi:hypothetical protein